MRDQIFAKLHLKRYIICIAEKKLGHWQKRQQEFNRYILQILYEALVQMVLVKKM